MGLVKFNNTTLNVDGVPDGAVILDGAQYSKLTDVGNAYALLKSKMPIGVDENQLSTLVEKGQRYDTVVAESAQLKTSTAELSTKLKAFDNMPADFTIEKWNKDRQVEKQTVFNQKIASLTEKVVASLKKEHPDKTPPTIDPRFMPQDKISAFNPDAEGAVDAWAKLMDEGWQEQTAFLQKQAASGVPSPAIGGGAPAIIPGGGGGGGGEINIPSVNSLNV